MSNKQNSYKVWETENVWIVAGITTILLAVAMPLTIFFVSKSSLSSDSFSKLGTVGDFLGGTTVGLLSLASILFLISTIFMQRKELSMQREELQLTREELVKANQQYEITNETMLKQQFETTFFNMINMHNNLINDLKINERIRSDTNVYHGREAIISFYENINRNYYHELYDTYIENILFNHQDDLEPLYNELDKICRDFLFNNNFRSFEEFQKEIRSFFEYEDFVVSKTDLLGIPYNKLSIIFKSKNSYPILVDSYKSDVQRKIHAFNITNKESKYFLSNYIKSVRTRDCQYFCVNDHSPFQGRSSPVYSISFVRSLDLSV